MIHTYFTRPPSERTRSTSRAVRRESSVSIVAGCAPPNTRREIRSASASVSTASRRSSSVAPSAQLYRNDDATLDDLREAVTTLEDIERIARRVFGGANPITTGIEKSLRAAQAKLGVRDTPSTSA